jgi:hypothetical protein
MLKMPCWSLPEQWVIGTLTLLLLAQGTPTTLGQLVRPKGAATKRAEDWEPVAGYKYREIDGFRLLVQNAVIEENRKSTDRRKPLDVLQIELGMIVHDLPPRCVTVLRTIPIWVEWDMQNHEDAEGRAAVAVYHPGNKINKRYRYDTLENAVKANCVDIVTMKLLTAEHQGERHRCVLLHEFSHAVHHHVFDEDNPVIKAAYAHAMSQGLYQNQYASTNEKEYFAEISCAYFGHLHYLPHTRAELQKYDPVGYRMMELTWGTPKEIEQAQRPEREKTAMTKLVAARKLLRDKQKQREGTEALRALVEEYPGTRAANDAVKLIEKQ